MQNYDSLADQLNHYNFYLGEPNSFNFDLTRYDNAANESIVSVVKKYFTKPFIELHIIPQTK